MNKNGFRVTVLHNVSKTLFDNLLSFSLSWNHFFVIFEVDSLLRLLHGHQSSSGQDKEAWDTNENVLFSYGFNWIGNHWYCWSWHRFFEFWDNSFNTFEIGSSCSAIKVLGYIINNLVLSIDVLFSSSVNLVCNSLPFGNLIISYGAYWIIILNVFKDTSNIFSHQIFIIRKSISNCVWSLSHSRSINSFISHFAL